MLGINGTKFLTHSQSKVCPPDAYHLTPLLHISFAPRRLECSSQPPVLLIPAILDNDISASTLDDSDSAKLYVTTSKTTHWLSSVEAVGTGQYRITIESD